MNEKLSKQAKALFDRRRAIQATVGTASADHNGHVSCERTFDGRLRAFHHQFAAYDWQGLIAGFDQSIVFRSEMTCPSV